jgi:hypothetical protein
MTDATPYRVRYLDEAWPERWFFDSWACHHLPMRMRGWPWLRKFYYQQTELDAAKSRAKRMMELFPDE